MKIVTLDPGKGGYNSGVIFDNLIEKEINLNIALKCREELLRHGVNVEMTREDDTYVGYSQRSVKGNIIGSDAFVSIHCNSGQGSLVELIYSINLERGLKLATNLGEEAMNNGHKAMKIYNHIGHGMQDFNTVIRETKSDVVIIKCGFLDNEYDRSLIDTVEKQHKFGVAIAKGILKYFEIEYTEQ